MTLPVFIADVTDARVGDEVVLDGDEGRHAVVVKRIGAGEQIALTDTTGTMATGRVLSTTKKDLTALVEEVRHEETPTPRFVVVQAIPKGDRGELSVEMLTEIGVDVIVPWAASRSVAIWRGERAAKSLAKWRNAAREAGKQSRRAHFPEVTEMMTTAEVAALPGPRVVLHEDGVQPLADVDLDAAETVTVIVGPEGGLSPEEIEAFGHDNVRRLGPSVLRTSTAGVVAVAALVSKTPRWLSG